MTEHANRETKLKKTEIRFQFILHKNRPFCFNYKEKSILISKKMAAIQLSLPAIKELRNSQSADQNSQPGNSILYGLNHDYDSDRN